jgi:RimJ/RimL family protein N-acetyltransferase
MRIDEVRTTAGASWFTIRSLERRDAEQALAFMHRMYSVSPFLARYPDEWTLTIQEEIAFIEMNLIDSERLLAGGFEEETLIVLGSVFPVGRNDKLAHRCECSISVLPEYQGKGVGTAFMQELINQARRAGYEQMELEVVSENRRAVQLYERLGFTHIGMVPRGFKNRDGSYHDLEVMARLL